MTVPTPQVPAQQVPAQQVIESSVRTAMAALEGIEDRPLAEHVEAFERVHAALGEALADPGVA